MRKRVLSVLIAAAVTFAGLCGCGTDTGGSAGGGDAGGGSGGTEAPSEAGGQTGAAGGMGRFLEQETDFPEKFMIHGMEKLDDGTVRVFGQSEESGQFEFYDSADAGGSWNMAGAVSGLENFYPLAGAVSPDGTAVLVTASYDENEVRQAQLAVMSPGQEAQQILLAIPETAGANAEHSNMIVACAFDEEGTLFAENLNGHVFEVDPATGECREFCDMEEAYSRNMEIAGHWLFALSGTGVAVFDSRDCSNAEDSFLDEMFAKNPQLGEKNTDFGANIVIAAGMAEDEIFYATHEGLFSHGIGGSVGEQLINGALNTMGNTSALFLNLLMLDEENFLLAVRLNGEIKVLKYTYDSNAAATPETELKVYALNDSNYLRQVVSAYQKQHQDVYVNLVIGMSGDDGVTAEDAIRALNTDILAGNGPDVLILDGLPMDSYIEKGILADIRPLIDELEESDGFFENVADVYEADGAVYGFPAKFYVMLAGGPADAAAAGASLQKTADYVEASGGKFPHGGAYELLEELYPVNSARFLSQNKLNEDMIKEFLTQAKRLYVPNEYEDMVLYGADTGNELFSTFNSVSILMGESCMAYGALTSMSGLTLETASCEKGGFGYALAGREEVKSFVPYQIAGIGSGTANKDTAEDFLRVMFGTECGSIDGNGFPVNRSAYELLCGNAMHMYGEQEKAGVAVSSGDGISLDLVLSNPTEEQIAELTGILEEPDTPAQMDRVIEEIVLEYGEAVLKGDIGVDEAVSAILQKCNLYLAE